MPRPIVITGRNCPVSGATIARNPGILDARGRIRDQVFEQKEGNALDQGVRGAAAGQPRFKGGGPFFRVTITSIRVGRLDDDNLRGGAKPLRDAIASFLRLDDREDQIVWDYAQEVNREKQGTRVKIEKLV